MKDISCLLLPFNKFKFHSLLWFFTLASASAVSQPAGTDTYYSLEQAAQGAELYSRSCAICHGVELRGSEAGPALIGGGFWETWQGRPLQELYSLTRDTMPVTNPGSFTPLQYAQLSALMLYMNGFPAGNQQLAENMPGFTSIVLNQPAASDSRPSLAALPGDVLETGMQSEWTSYHADLAATHYSPLTQINRENVQELELAWRWYSANHGPSPEFNYEATPLMLDGVLYTTAGYRRDVIAIDASTGENLWMYRFDEGERRGPRVNSGRGVAAWRDGQDTRIIVVTPGYFMISLDARTGQPDPGFGTDGVLDLREGLDDRFSIEGMPVGLTSPPVIIGDIIVVGAAFPSGGAPPSMTSAAGNIRAFDVHTGQQLWLFHTIPQEGEFGTETWRNESWRYSGNAGAWATFSADARNGIVYVPVEAATHDMYGGHRPGDNLFSQSLVALDVHTGERIWHYQLVHHDVWDYDPPTAAVLTTLNVEGEEIPAAIQATKQGMIFTFNRLTGEPVWPIEERAVPASSVPGEQLSPTQPFPVLPAPFERLGITEDDLIDFTPELREEALQILEEYTYGPVFTPPSLVTENNRGTIYMPGFGGGANWQGVALDPQSNILYVPSTSHPMRIGLKADPGMSEMDYVMNVQGGFVMEGPHGLPLIKPPYGRITAIDMNTGEHLWMMANADTPDEIRNHDMLQDVEIERTGHGDRGGLLVTGSLLFAGEGAGLYGGQTGGGRMFRAHDKRTGEILAEIELPAKQTGLPMTYMVDDVQYIVVPIGDQGHPGELVALRLPQQ